MALSQCHAGPQDCARSIALRFKVLGFCFHLEPSWDLRGFSCKPREKKRYVEAFQASAIYAGRKARHLETDDEAYSKL